MKKKIDWEERRFLVSAIILGGMAANYHNGLYPEREERVKTAILMADCLIQKLKDPSFPSHSSKQYQRKDI